MQHWKRQYTWFNVQEKEKILIKDFITSKNIIIGFKLLYINSINQKEILGISMILLIHSITHYINDH